MALTNIPAFTFNHVDQADRPSATAAQMKTNLDSRSKNIRDTLETYWKQQITEGKFNFAASAAGTDTYVLTIANVASYAAGLEVFMLADVANIGAATVNVNSLGAVNIRKNGTTVLEDGDIPAGGVVHLKHDGTNFQLIGKATANDILTQLKTVDGTGSGLDADLLDGNHAVAFILTSLLTTQGDIPYATAASTWARLAKGTALQTLQINSGATAPEWAASPQSVLTAAGDLLYASAANTLARLAKGTAGQELRINSGATAPEWHTPVLQANLLTNGGFEIWQRGAGPFTASAYTADRWRSYIEGTDTMSISREGVIKKSNSLYSAKFVYTKGTGSAGQLSQALIIADGFHHLLGKTISLRVSLHANATGAARIGIETNGTGGSALYSSYHVGDSAWANLDVSYTAPVDATFIFIHLDLRASVTAYFDNAMLVVDSQAADYMPLHPAEEMAKCQRYYEVHGGVASGIPSVGRMYASGAASYMYGYTFQTKKAGTPT
ncbi:MAG: hypothetical protein ACYC4H_00790, partial [Desulfocucumaceae bacterium]